MYIYNISPRFSETTFIGHINHSAIAVWLEEARTPIYRIFNPNLGAESWNLALARVEFDFKAEIFHGEEVEIKTWIQRIGSSSAKIYHEIFQNNKLAVKSTATLVYFDYKLQKILSITDEIRNELTKHLKKDEQKTGV